jgi:ribosomal protein L13
VIINADKVSVTGRKETEKMYFRHTIGRPGGMRMESLRDLRQVSVPPPCSAVHCTALHTFALY